MCSVVCIGQRTEPFVRKDHNFVTLTLKLKKDRSSLSLALPRWWPAMFCAFVLWYWMQIWAWEPADPTGLDPAISEKFFEQS